MSPGTWGAKMAVGFVRERERVGTTAPPPVREAPERRDRPGVIEVDRVKAPPPPAAPEPPAAPPAPRGGQRLLALALLIPALALVAFFGLRWLAYSRAHVSTDDAVVDGYVYPVNPK